MCLTKHHFVHAHKIIDEGCRTVFNAGTLPARLRDDDTEGLTIQEHGIDAIIYSADLWNDPSAMQAIMVDDNLDANCRLAEGELDAFGRVHDAIISMLADANAANVELRITEDDVMKHMEEHGLGNIQPASRHAGVTNQI